MALRGTDRDTDPTCTPTVFKHITINHTLMFFTLCLGAENGKKGDKTTCCQATAHSSLIEIRLPGYTPAHSGSWLLRCVLNGTLLPPQSCQKRPVSHQTFSHLKLYLKKWKCRFKVVIFHCMNDHERIMTDSVQTWKVRYRQGKPEQETGRGSPNRIGERRPALKSITSPCRP